MQRFGSSLNLNVHLHVVVVDGVFSGEGRDLEFTPASPPTHAEMAAILGKVRKRVEKLSSRDAAHVEHPLGACARIALAPGSQHRILRR